MDPAPTQPALTVAWLLVAVLLKVTQGERVSAALPSAAVEGRLKTSTWRSGCAGRLRALRG
ncbi:hypothetical protein AB0D34_20745 [Streptomyces sp. NPDC048420]|uniref:hypothetical protein n=1 Tax=Streptomyces sp. NPDC048420 TaxID=3155755 RepID=UPI003442074C